MFKQIKWTVPNILSVYRLLSVPFVLVFIYLGYETLFLCIFIFNQITDILDGYIARKYNLTSPIGALLDSWADLGSYVLAIAGIFKFQVEIFNAPYLYWLIAYLFVYLMPIIISLLKFKQVSVGLHLYTSKISAYCLGLFFVLLFTFNLIPIIFYICFGIGFLAELEMVAVLLIIKQPVQNAKGLYWVLRN